MLPMEKLKQDLTDINNSILQLKSQIEKAESDAKNNIKPLTEELEQLRIDKRNFALKNDFDSVQSCIRRENNLKFKINAHWNEYSILNNNLSKLKKQKTTLENQINLKKDQIKRNNDILAQMDRVLYNYKKSQNLMRAAADSKINPDLVKQWYEWGKNDFTENSTYFYTKIKEIDDYFKDVEFQKLKKQMDDVIEAYKKTDSLKEASKIAGVSYNTVQYWYEWGSKGFGEENSYFFKKLESN